MLIVLYSAFAALSGVVEAVLYSRRGAEAFSRNEHAEMVAQRLAVLLLVPAAILVYGWSNWWYVGAELVAAVLCFPMVHDEAYNFTRLWIREREEFEPLAADAHYFQSYSWYRPRPLWLWWMEWKDYAAFLWVWKREYRYGYQSPTTTARNDFNGRTRTLLAIAGAVVEVAALYLVCHG